MTYEEKRKENNRKFAHDCKVKGVVLIGLGFLAFYAGVKCIKNS